MNPPTAPFEKWGLDTPFDHFIASVLSTFNVPGVAVGVVKDFNTILSQGFGVRELGSSDLVTETTLFGIGSCTKAFTAAALAILVDEGKLSWSDPVIKHLPSFRMYDPYVTENVTICDLLTHRSGLGFGQGDLLIWPSTNFTSEEITHRVRYLKPEKGFRSGFAYDNVLYVVCGHIVKAVSGQAWGDFVTERIFKVLKMTNSITTLDFSPHHKVASPHVVVNGELVPVPYADLTAAGPAGSINSTIEDMLIWANLQLREGALENSGRLFSQAQSQVMQTPETILPLRYPIKNFAAYAPGWVLMEYGGSKVVCHIGGICGMVSKVTLVPSLNLGIVVLTNQDVIPALEAITYQILDCFIPSPSRNWLLDYKQRFESSASKEPAHNRVLNTKPSLPLASYCRTYRDAWYGDVALSADGDTIRMVFSRTPLLQGSLEHWHYDTFVVRWDKRELNADAFLTFSLSVDGSIDQLKMLAFSPTTDISYDYHHLLFHPVK